jgi:dihydrofolate reductase
MKLTTMTQVTIDGVYQGNGEATEAERRSGFVRGGWARGAGDHETDARINQTYQRAHAFLLGRRTYELFARSWGSFKEQDVPGWEPTWQALNTKPKYVASSTLADPRWSGTTVLSGDVAAAVRELKSKPGGELQIHGSGILIQHLLEKGLVDEMTLIVVPVILGQGRRLFPETGPDLAIDLVDSRVDSTGVFIGVYRPAGRPKYEETQYPPAESASLPSSTTRARRR